MKKLKNIFLLLTGVMVLFSCNKQIADDQVNPNSPTSVPAQLILGTVLTAVSGNGCSGSLGGIQSWDVVQGWNQYHCQNYNYYGNNIYSWTQGTHNELTSNTASGPFNSYLVLKNVAQMQKEVKATGGSALNPYEAIGRFVTAWYYYNMTSLMGDVPLTQALSSSTTTPAYTAQEQVFLYVLNQLDSANSDLAALIAQNDASLSSSQDIYYGGKLGSWQKLVNSFKLRVLVALSPKASDATLNVPAQFANILGNPGKYPIFTSQADDF